MEPVRPFIVALGIKRHLRKVNLPEGCFQLIAQLPDIRAFFVLTSIFADIEARTRLRPGLCMLCFPAGRKDGLHSHFLNAAQIAQDVFPVVPGVSVLIFLYTEGVI